MKSISTTFVILCTALFNSLQSSAPTLIKNSSSWLASGQLSQSSAQLVKSVSSYPATGIVQKESGLFGQQYIQDRTTKATVPINITPILQKGNFSILRPKGNEYQNYPTGKTLFPDYPQLATRFDNLISMLIKQPKLITFLRKVHLNILNELYKYLIGIYLNFNLQHVGIKDITGSNGRPALKINVPLFLQDEATYAANKKTLIINHFINIIESQMNSSIRAIMPKIPHLYATYSGKTLIQNDYSIDLTDFMLQQIEPAMIQYKQQYLQALAVYIAFFQEYTSYLNQTHPKQQSFTAFVHIAETINQFLYGDQTATTPEKKTKQLLTKMDPPMFHLNYDDIRALKLIPHLAKTLPTGTKNIAWPEHIIDAANEIILINKHPMAYFKDAVGNVVKSSQGATRLFIVMQAGKDLFQEELIVQPDWLNNWSGVSKILQGCFGNFAALLEFDILDPCTKTLIQNALDIAQGKNVNADASAAQVCKTFVSNLKKEDAPSISSVQVASLKDLSNILPEQQLPAKKPSTAPTKSKAFNASPSANDISTLSPSAQDISSPLTQ